MVGFSASMRRSSHSCALRLWKTQALEESVTVPDLSIRLAGQPDAAVLAELAADTFPLACPPSTTAAAIAAFIAANFTVERMTEYLADPDRTLLVAEEPDGHAVGYSMLIAGEPGDSDAATSVVARPAIELSKFYTRALAHGSGVVAGPLMSATLDSAAVAGAATVWLGVNEENARAIRFYEKHGFAKVGHKHFRLGDRFEDDWVLERRLD
jgi:tRNA (guanine37-N1)-methyltransferase